jgi:AcrR family transcriptional regulator
MHRISQIPASQKRPAPTRGQAQRQRILEQATALAAKEGLEGLTIGRLAEVVGMSKGGLFAHFGSKEELQLACMETARERFIDEVVVPVQHVERGLPRLYQTLSAWIRSVERSREQGGCFFFAASADFDGRPGPVRDTLLAISQQWLDWIMRQAVVAIERGHLKKSTDVAQLAFEMHAFGQQANWSAQLVHDPDAFDRARRAIRDRLAVDATDAGRALLPGD